QKSRCLRGAEAFLEYMDDNDIIAILQDFEVAKIVDIYMQMWSGEGDQAIAELIETERSSPSDAPSGQPDYTYASTPDIGLIADGETHSEKIAIQLPDGTWSYGAGGSISYPKTDPVTGEVHDFEQPVLVANVKGIDGFLTEGLRRIVPIETERGLKYMLVHSNGDIIPEIIVVPPSDPTDVNASWLALAAQEADVTAETTEILTDPVVDDTLYIRPYENVGELGEPEEVFNARRLDYGAEEALEVFSGGTAQEAPNPLKEIREMLRGMDETQTQPTEKVQELKMMVNGLSQDQAIQLSFKQKAKLAHIFFKYVQDNNFSKSTFFYNNRNAVLYLSTTLKEDLSPGVSAPISIRKSMKKMRSDIYKKLKDDGVLDQLKSENWTRLTFIERQNLLEEKITPTISDAYNLEVPPEVSFVDFDNSDQGGAYSPVANTITYSNSLISTDEDTYLGIELAAHELMHAWQFQLINKYRYNQLPPGNSKDYAILLTYAQAYQRQFKVFDFNDYRYNGFWIEAQAFDISLALTHKVIDYINS
ncbi:MAG: hypothetical protein AAF228_14180, partial [Pseudomonadota bacterium]